MSAPLHDPLVVNTQDGRCWVRRAWSQDGRGLYGLEGSPEDAAEDKAEQEGKKEEAAKKEARLRPQPKTASTGATRLGGGVIGKAAASEVSELSSLWESAPDVSKFF